MNIAVIGSGGWGTAITMLLHENGHKLTLCSYSEQESEALARTLENPFLKGVPLPQTVTYTADAACVRGKDMVVLAPPSFAVRATAGQIAPHLDDGTILVSVTKGIESESGKTMSQIIHEVTGRPAVVLSGPSHAEEVGRGIPTGVVVAGTERVQTQCVQEAFMCPRFRVYTCSDPIGVELAAALKNVIALCAGICDGLGYGDNTKALLVTRGLSEVARLGIALGAKQVTFAGLAGVGDLIVTCTSMHSRNRRAGILIGQGVEVHAAMQQVGAVVEGYYAAKSAMELSQKAGVDMPITTQAYEVLYNAKPAADALRELMTRKKSHETEDIDWI